MKKLTFKQIETILKIGISIFLVVTVELKLKENEDLKNKSKVKIPMGRSPTFKSRLTFTESALLKIQYKPIDARMGIQSSKTT